MNRYENGKIYKIWDTGYNKCYIGSTTEPLSKRMERHRKDYKVFLQGKRSNIRVFQLFLEFGVENCKIELLEKFPCNDKKELEAREGHHQRENECVNKCIAGRSREEWRQVNRDYDLQRKKDYKKQYKEYFKQLNRKDYENNRTNTFKWQKTAMKTTNKQF